MADLLSTGVSGLLAAQVGLSTTGHNVSNVNTDGYSRQQVSFGARAPQAEGRYYVGTGVDTVAVQRAYSQHLNAALWSAASSKGRADAFQGLTDQLNNQLSGSSNLQSSLDTFFGAVQDMANAPADASARGVLLARAGALASTFRALSGQFGSLDGQVQRQLTDTVASINSDSAAIAKLNERIRASTGEQPADLLDQRDALIKKLSGEVGISVASQSDGTLSVFVGNGQALVSGTQSYELGTAQNSYDATRLEVVDKGTGAVLSGRIGGGTLGALLDFRSNVLDPAQNQLGRAALAMADAMNAQHAQGVDLNGQLGGDLFTVAGPAVQAASSNAGSATLAADIDDIGALGNQDYVLSYDGSAWGLRDGSGATVAMSGSGTAADPFKAGGLSFVVGGGAASAGDSFRIQPTRNAAGSMAVAITDPNQLAAAAPLVGSAASANTGSAGVGALTVADGSDPNLFAGSSIVFASPTSYSIDGGPAQTFTPGTPIEHNGWSLTLDGDPAAGDSFGVQANANARGDNANALKLGAVANLGVLDGGATSVGRAYGQLVGQVGSAGALADEAAKTQNAVFNQAMAAQQSVSGVNIDEEAANLVRFQQAYQASAQIITAANTVFNALLGAFRG
ncbi:flagellar hook-associated protein FlgK [Frateuria sp. STR12]|uniref:flagellar hook-associated protein FlgK n=1 Tax=Frateuria hangzhouensis TaxID=2995589 RepID=UPI002260E7BD|nr:flagellar hook-associated protein FlgK [Frateuria sp. STR12]MCX7513131.1 flagellar hook-associated protein FlgK [Frateuria sp. STR12]